MREIVVPDPEALAREASRLFVEAVAEAVSRRGSAFVALAGGSTPRAAYEILACEGAAIVPWERVVLVAGDERDGAWFNIYRKSVFSWIGKLFGVKDIEIGDTFFDDEFIIQGEPEALVSRLLFNTAVRQLIQAQPDIHFQVKDDDCWFKSKFPEGVDELYFEVVGVIKDRERLKNLFDLFALVLDELCRFGSAYETDPNVILE